MTSSQTIVLITGANQGVGFETAKNLLLSSPTYHILLGSRDLTKGDLAISQLKSLNIKGTITPLQIDVTSEKSISAAANLVEETYGRIDILVNNAGIVCEDKSKIPDHQHSTTQNLRAILEVNVIGVVGVTEAFLPLLRKSSAPRLVFVSSSMGSLSQAYDPNSKYHRPGAKEYRCSKAALNMLMVQYGVALVKEGFKVFGADPGLTATDFTGNPELLRARGAVEPEVGGERIATVVKGERDADVGRVCGEYGVSPW